MDNLKTLFISYIFCIVLFGCRNDNDGIEFSYTPLIAVEGWIENDAYPMVILTQTAPFLEEMDTTFLLNHIIKSAKVVVSDGSVSEILTLRTNHDYFPPYVYTGNLIKGEVGKRYYLDIFYKNENIKAETYIPKPVPLDDIWFEKESIKDSTGYIYISFVNTIDADCFYQIMTQTAEKESRFTPCLYGNIDGASFNQGEMVSIQINKGPVLLPKASYETSFLEGETVFVKIRTQPRHGYDFWTGWQNEIINAQNPIFPANTSLNSTIQGGVGIWCGYGSKTYRIDTKKKDYSDK